MKGIGHLQAALTSRLASIKLSEVKDVVLAYVEEHPDHKERLLSHARTVYALKRHHKRSNSG